MRILFCFTTKRTDGDEEVFSGGGDFTDGGGGGAGGSSGMPGRGRGRDRDSHEQQGGGGGAGAGAAAAAVRGGSGGNAFEDYDEEEVAALEAYMKTHPTKEEDKEALRKRAKELSASIGIGSSSSSGRVSRCGRPPCHADPEPRTQLPGGFSNPSRRSGRRPGIALLHSPAVTTACQRDPCDLRP